MRVHASVFIERPIAAVFDYLATPGNIANWVAGVAAVNGPRLERQGVGVRLTVTGATGPTSLSPTWEVISFEPPRDLAMRSLEDDRNVEVRWTLEQLPTGYTRVLAAADFAWLSFFQPEPQHVERLARRSLVDHLEVLRRQLEAPEAQ